MPNWVFPTAEERDLLLWVFGTILAYFALLALAVILL